VEQGECSTSGLLGALGWEWPLQTAYAVELAALRFQSGLRHTELCPSKELHISKYNH